MGNVFAFSDYHRRHTAVKRFTTALNDPSLTLFPDQIKYMILCLSANDDRVYKTDLDEQLARGDYDQEIAKKCFTIASTKLDPLPSFFTEEIALYGLDALVQKHNVMVLERGGIELILRPHDEAHEFILNRKMGPNAALMVFQGRELEYHLIDYYGRFQDLQSLLSDIASWIDPGIRNAARYTSTQLTTHGAFQVETIHHFPLEPHDKPGGQSLQIVPHQS